MDQTNDLFNPRLTAYIVPSLVAVLYHIILTRENHLGALACPCRAVAAFLYYHLVNEFETRNYLVGLFRSRFRIRLFFLISCQINFIGLVVMTLNLFTGGGNGYLKVRKSAKQFVVSSILPKNEQKSLS